MRRQRTWATAAIVALAVGSTAFAVVYTEGFESGYTDGSNLTEYPAWYGDTGDPSYAPTIEATNGLAGGYGLSQAQKTFQWKAHPFDWSNPAITGVVIGIDFETTWITEGTEYKPFDDDYVGWTVDDTSTSSGDIFGVQLEGNEVRGQWRNPGASGSEINPVIVTIPDTLPELSWYRLRVEYTKLTATSLRMDVSLTELDADGNLGNVVASGTIEDTSSGSYSKTAGPAQFVGPMWFTAKNYNQKSPGNADNVYLEIIPEPATLILLAAPGVFLVGRRRRRA